MLDFFGERVGDGRWDKLRVLDLTDCCHVGDIGLYRLSAAIEAGFGSALEELDLSVQFNVPAYVACADIYQLKPTVSSIRQDIPTT